MSYNEALNGLTYDQAAHDDLPAVQAANVDGRRYQVTKADLSTLNIAPHFRGVSMAYIGTEDHPHLAAINPKFHFDDLDLDRLINVTIAREWSRAEGDPRRGILIMGDKGVGKTQYLRQRLARQGIPCAVISWRPEMDAVDLIYSKTLIGGDVSIEKGVLWLAAEGGYPVVIEEIDVARPAQLVALNEIIDTGTITIPETGEVIHARRGFCVFANCNSSFTEDRHGGFAGTRSQNISVLDRFFKYTMEAPSDEAQAKFVKALYPDVSDEDAGRYGAFMGMLRKAASSDGSGVSVQGSVHRVSLGFSRRNLIDWMDMTGSFAYLADQHISVPKYALGPIYTNVLPANEKATVEHLFDLAFGVTQ